jgi:4'-phosphopantetheinyl transferase
MAAVAVHHGRLDLAAGEVERLAALLAPEEHAQAARYRFARDRRRFVVRRARLRQCLSAQAGIAPERLVLVEGPFGKPALAGGPHFSLSHSGEHWALAIAGVPIGVDVEQLNPAIDHADIAKGLFGPRECAALAALPADRAPRGFFDCWARKEAFVKAIGLGLSYPLDAFEVSVAEAARLRVGGEGWAIRELAIAPELAGAVVAQDDGRPLTLDLRNFDTARAAA